MIRPGPYLRGTVLVAMALMVAQAAIGCPVCYGDPNSPMTKSTNNGVLFLLGVIGFVQIGFVSLFISFWRRARRIRQRRAQFRVIEGLGR